MREVWGRLINTSSSKEGEMAGQLEKERDRNMWDVRGDERSYDKELTVLVEMEGEDRITMMELLKSMKEARSYWL